MSRNRQPPLVSLVRLRQPIVGYATDVPHGHRFARHRHASAQLIYAARGVMRVTTDQGRWIVPPELAVWIPPLVPHAIAMSGEVAMRTLYVKRGFPPGAPRTCRVVAVTPLLRELIVRIADPGAARRPRAARERLLRVALDELEFVDLAPLHLPLPRDPRALAVARAILGGQERRPLAALGRAHGASERTLARLFVRETGRGFARWRQQASLLRALELLARGDSVTRVALDVGYASVSAFIAIFRAALGTTPARYFTRPADREIHPVRRHRIDREGALGARFGRTRLAPTEDGRPHERKQTRDRRPARSRDPERR